MTSERKTRREVSIQAIADRLGRAPAELADARAFRLPSLNDRVTINGRTGSGKTVAGAWLLSMADFHRQPFIIINYKGEKLFDKITRAKPLTINDDLPSAPGIYHMQPLVSQVDEMEAWLWSVWKQAEIGLFIDEGYLLPDKKAFATLLTTGRSRQIPIYTLSQRPVRLPRFTISESDFYQCFHLHDERDRETVEKFTPKDGIWADTSQRLKKYNSRWYDVGADFSCMLDPVPDMAQILATFDRRLTPRQTLL